MIGENFGGFAIQPCHVEETQGAADSASGEVHEWLIAKRIPLVGRIGVRPSLRQFGGDGVDEGGALAGEGEAV